MNSFIRNILVKVENIASLSIPTYNDFSGDEKAGLNL